MISLESMTRSKSLTPLTGSTVAVTGTIEPLKPDELVAGVEDEASAEPGAVDAVGDVGKTKDGSL